MSDWRRKTEQEVLEILASNSPLNLVEIAKAADAHPITVEHACIRLQEKGRVRSNGGGFYEPASTERTERSNYPGS